MFKHSEAFSFQIATADQSETDRYWNAIVGNGGAESACGWCKDKWGLSWQITPRVLTEMMAKGGEVAKWRSGEECVRGDEAHRIRQTPSPATTQAGRQWARGRVVRIPRPNGPWLRLPGSGRSSTSAGKPTDYRWPRGWRPCRHPSGAEFQPPSNGRGALRGLGSVAVQEVLTLEGHPVRHDGVLE